MFCNVAMCCSVLQCIAVCCTVLQRVAACCSMLLCAAVCCTVLLCVAEWRRPIGCFIVKVSFHKLATKYTAYFRKETCKTRQHISLRHTATHCNTLQHTARHCSTLQHIADLCVCAFLYTIRTTQHMNIHGSFAEILGSFAVI